MPDETEKNGVMDAARKIFAILTKLNKQQSEKVLEALRILLEADD